MIGRLRLIDAVVIAAVAMLGLKVLGLLSGQRSSSASVVASAPHNISGEQLPAFARVLAHARSNYMPPDVGTTGAVPDEKKEASGPTQDKAEESHASVEPAPTGSPSERAILERLGERRDQGVTACASLS